MPCDEMNEWEQIEEVVEEVVEEIPEEIPSKEVIMEEIHEQSHIMIDIQKLISGRPNLKKKEMAEILVEATKMILGKYKSSCSKKLGKLVTAKAKGGKSEKQKAL